MISHTLQIETDLLGERVLVSYSAFGFSRRQQISILPISGDIESVLDDGIISRFTSRGYIFHHDKTPDRVILYRESPPSKQRPIKNFDMKTPSLFCLIRQEFDEWWEVRELPVSINYKYRKDVLHYSPNEIVPSRLWSKALSSCIHKLQKSGFYQIDDIIPLDREKLAEEAALTQRECNSLEKVLARAGLRLNSKLHRRHMRIY